MGLDNQQEAPLVPAGDGGLARSHSRAPATEAREQPGSSDLVPVELVRVVLRRYRVVLACLLLVLGVTALLTLTAPRVYEARATFLVSDPHEDGGPATSDQLPPMAEAISAPWLETHASLITRAATAKETQKWLAAHGGAVKGSVSATIVPKTQLIELRAWAGSPRDAERLANATATCYLATMRGLAQSASNSAGRYLGEQLTVARAKLTEAEDSLRRFKESTGTVADDAEAADLLTRAAGVRTDLDKSEADLAQARDRLANVREQLADQNSRISTSDVRDDTVVTQLREHLVDLEGQRLAASARYTSEMPGPVKALDKQIALTKKQLESEVRAIVGTGGGDLTMQQTLVGELSQAEVDVASLVARVKELQPRLAETDRQLARVPARQIALARLEREVSVAQGVHEDLLRRSQENEVGRVMALGNASLVEEATAPHSPVSPRPSANLLLGLLLGLALGVGTALVLEQLNDVVSQEEEVSRVVGAPVVETVPVLPRADIAAMLAETQQPRRALEAYSGLRYTLGSIPPTEGARTVLVTSASAGEGKTTTAVNLAIAAALGGRRTVLVDADMRRPTVSKLLGLNGAKGLSDYLSRQASLDEVMQSYGELGLTVISSGGHAPNPTNLLDSERMQEFVGALRRQADLVVFDSVPMLSAADGLIMAGLSDAVLLVVVPQSSRRHALRRSRTLLAATGRSFAGVILNKVPVRPGYGRYYGYYADRRYQSTSLEGGARTDREREA